MLHKDKQLTRAVSHLLRDDIQHLLDKNQMSFEIHDSGITPSSYKSPPRAIFFLRQSKHYQPNDWVMQQKYDGGGYYTIVLKIDNELWNGSSMYHKYNGKIFIECKVYYGMSWNSRYKQTRSVVCGGIYSLLDAPDSTEIMAQKIVKSIEKMRSGHIIIDPH